MCGKQSTSGTAAVWGVSKLAGKQRHLRLEGSHNIRDIGGYATLDGGETRWRTLIRADNLDKLPLHSQQALIDEGVNTIIDLRDTWETAKFSNVFAGSNRVNYLHRPLLEHQAIYDQMQDVERLDDMYRVILDGCQAQIKAILEAIPVDAQACTVVHCSAGKDRTGMVIMLLLALGGVPAATIAEDYALSSVYLTEWTAQRRQKVVADGGDLKRFEEDVSSRPETMLNTLDYLETALGGIDTYLKTVGLEQARILQLKQWLVTSRYA